MACLFASHLALYTSVTLIGSWQQQIDKLNTDGLTIIGLDGERRHVAAASDDTIE